MDRKKIFKEIENGNFSLQDADEKLKADKERLNVNGGAMALGHPLGGTGAKLMTTLLHELERRDGKYGLQAICEGGGTANAMVIERLS